jgi:hypothetical protein
MFLKKPCKSHPKGFRRSGVVYFDNNNRSLRGQEGMVDAWESHRAATAAQFWIRLPR